MTTFYNHHQTKFSFDGDCILGNIDFFLFVYHVSLPKSH